MTNLIFTIAIFIAAAGMLLALFRLIKGPTVADRAVSLDVMTIIGISVIGFISFVSGRIIYLDVALVYGLISFLGIIALARYVEGGV